MSPHATAGCNDGIDALSMKEDDVGNGDAMSQQAQAENRPSYLRQTSQDDLHDLICVGFGPASLAIAIALNDALEYRMPGFSSLGPKVCFLEKQDHFAWHAGMQLNDAKMQISWIKDLATMRNPRSKFTFLNYLFVRERLIPFTNLSTFLPLRIEYEDYMRWCANHFEDVVNYRQEGLEVTPVKSRNTKGLFDAFQVKTRNLSTGAIEIRTTRHVVLSLGGRPKMPAHLPQDNPRVIHTSAFNWVVPKLLSDREAPYRVAVIGAGQSAAETFTDLHARYPNSQTRLIIRSGALRPSDDSPFVNEIFDPNRVDTTYAAPAHMRAADIISNRATNYSVVRLELLEHLHAKLYKQRLRYASEAEWPHKILAHRELRGINDVDVKRETNGNKNGFSVMSNGINHETLEGHTVNESFVHSDINGDAHDRMDGNIATPNCPVRIHLTNHEPEHYGRGPARSETITADLAVVAAGYERNSHEDLLRNMRHLMPASTSRADDSLENGEPAIGEKQTWQVSRDYRVIFAEGKVAPDAGVWLQGCNEGTHGLSDTLLSVLATRSGEIVCSIFAPARTPIR